MTVTIDPKFFWWALPNLNFHMIEKFFGQPWAFYAKMCYKKCVFGWYSRSLYYIIHHTGTWHCLIRQRNGGVFNGLYFHFYGEDFNKISWAVLFYAVIIIFPIGRHSTPVKTLHFSEKPDYQNVCIVYTWFLKLLSIIKITANLKLKFREIDRENQSQIFWVSSTQPQLSYDREVR